jgi:hypothetical protein
LDTITGTVNESAKLLASDASAGDRFGNAVAVSGNVGVVGARNRDEGANFTGAAYLFIGLDTFSGTVNETVKLLSSERVTGDFFGTSVSIDGDRFAIGASGGEGLSSSSGSAYSGTVSSITTMDVGDASNFIDGISFSSRADWVIGETTSNNSNWLTNGDAGEVREDGTAIRVGASAGSNGNSLKISGELSAIRAFIGADGNEDNSLILDSVAEIAIDSIVLFEDNLLELEGEFDSYSALALQLDSTDLFVASNGITELVTAENFADVLEAEFDDVSGYTTYTALAISAIPEPSSFMFVVLVSCVAVTRRLRAIG